MYPNHIQCSFESKITVEDRPDLLQESGTVIGVDAVVEVVSG